DVYKRQDSPTRTPATNPPPHLVIGIAGGSASGKSSLAHRLAHGLGPHHCAVIAHDRYYRDHPRLTAAERQQLDYDHPDAIETALLLRHLRALRAGRAIALPHYDYARHGRAAETTPLHRAPVIIIEGLFVLADARLRRVLDLKIFVHADDELRLARRIKRDTTERGQPLTEVLERYETRVRPGHERHVDPSRQHADLVWDQANDDTFPSRLLTRLRQTP
ncbi:MAG: uridine kinase, partial [Opitutus sp.]|nr:uridine kinase [Opitutus sp.]